MSHTPISPPPRNTPPPVLDLVAFKRTLAEGQVWEISSEKKDANTTLKQDAFDGILCITRNDSVRILKIMQKRAEITITDEYEYCHYVGIKTYSRLRRQFITLDALRFMLQNHELCCNE